MSDSPPPSQQEPAFSTSEQATHRSSFADTLEAMHIIRYRSLTRDPSRGGYVLTKTVIAVLLAVTVWVPRWVGSPACRAARETTIGSLISLQIVPTRTYMAPFYFNHSFDGLCPEPLSLYGIPIYSANPLSPTKWLTWWFGTW